MQIAKPSTTLTRRFTALPRLERLYLLLVPPLFLLCACESALRIVYADLFIWNEIRLARTFGLYRGIPLYPGRDATGPILGTLHTPLSHILYWPATLAPNPVAAVRIGVFLSVLLVVSALLYTFIAASRLHPASSLQHVLRVSFALDLLWLIVLHSNVFSSIFVIHADPIAIACSTLAGGLLAARPAASRSLLLAALFALLSVAAKQTFLTVPAALCLFVLLADGWRALRIFCLWLLLWATLLGSGVLALFRPTPDLLFNIVTLSSHRPPQPILQSLPHAHDSLGLASAKLSYVILHNLHSGTEAREILLFLILISSWLLVLRRARPADWRLPLPQLLSHHRWLVFVVVALVIFPLLFKASITIGGDHNHLAIVCYFLGLALSLSLLHQPQRSPQQPPATSFNLSTSLPTLFIACFLLFLLFRTRLQRDRILSLGSHLTAEAAAFSLAHPGVAYFASNPLGAFYAEHTFYTLDHSIYDREIAGFPIPTAQYQSGLPHNPQLIVIDERNVVVDEISRSVVHYLDSGWVRTTIPELSGFAVYRRK